MTPEVQRLYDECERELNRIRAQIDVKIKDHANPASLYPEVHFLLEMMERLVTGVLPNAGPKTAWDRIKDPE